MKHILIADDHAEIRRLLVVTLQRKFEVTTADNGIAALQLARKLSPSAILLDVMMPGELDGFQVLQAIKSDPATCRIRVALLTARCQQKDIELARALGANKFFVKPFSPLQILQWAAQSS